MAWTDTEIANRALRALGINKPIVDLDTDDTTRAKALRDSWDLAVDLLDSEFPWPHSKRVQEMSLVDGSSSDPYSDQWTYAYRYGSTWKGLIGVVEDGFSERGVVEDTKIEYDTISDASGRLILTDLEDASALVLVIPETGYYPAKYAEALAILLAKMAGPSLFGETKQAVDLLPQYTMALAEAKVAAANEGGYERRPDSPSIQARRGISSTSGGLDVNA